MPRENLPQGPAGHPGNHLAHDGPATASPDKPRIIALDVLRGFTLCEILLANIQLIANHGTAVVTRPMGDWDP